MLKRGVDWWNLIWPVGLRPGSIPSGLFALACVATATLARIAVGFVNPDSAAFAPYYPATLVAALVGGTPAGVVAALLGWLVAFLLFAVPRWGATTFIMGHLVSIIIFSVSSAAIIWAAESYRSLLHRLRHEERLGQLLNHELAHRIKNAFANVQTIVAQTLEDQKPVRDELSARIAALAATNDLLIKSDWRQASLRQILVNEFAAYDRSRFRLDGHDVECPPSTATLLALIIHELTTNASKYGALSKPNGKVHVIWEKSGSRFDLAWIEHGGPKPKQGMRSGFGTKLLNAGLRQFNGSAQVLFKPTGLWLRISLHFPSDVPPTYVPDDEMRYVPDDLVTFALQPAMHRDEFAASANEATDGSGDVSQG
jgi:two-component sensor histidine kinase